MFAPTEEHKAGLNIAFNESTLLGAEIVPERSLVAVTLDVLSLPPEGPPSDDRRIQMILHPVGRVAASLRLGHWDDDDAKVVPFEAEALLSIVEGFKSAIYGWEFFDVEAGFDNWRDRLSLDYRSGDDGNSHSITLFQEDANRHLDLRIWFDQLQLKNPDGQELDVSEVIAGGTRWWDDLYAGGERSRGEGIYPLAEDSVNRKD